jgi:hypothetical protein
VAGTGHCGSEVVVMPRLPVRLMLPVVAITCAATAVPALASPTAAPITRGLPHVASGHRPGPDILYAAPPRAPQLENTGVWKAQPILVSGASAYRHGEWLYQDYLFDDHGASAGKQQSDPYGPNAHLYSSAGGTYVYPQSPTYANNAADLVEFRVKPLATATAFRVTLNTLKDASRSAFTVAIGGGTASAAWPYGAGVSSPASYFLTWHGRTAVLTTAAGRVVSPAPAVHVDLLRRQITVTVPHRAWDPRRSTVRMTVGVGLWDTAAGTYLKPSTGDATASTPGGGTPTGVAIVNVGPRYDEPMPVYAGSNMGDTAAAGEAAAPWWRERKQSEQLALGDVSPFFADVDFGKLSKRVTDDSTVPTSGPIDRIFASHYSFGQGVDPTKVCYVLGSFSAGAKCIGRDVGQLQPYALYVPKKPRPRNGYGLTLLLHSLSANYNQYLASRNQSQLGDRGPGSIVLTPGGRGPDGFYAGIAEADTFEAWADVARHYALDPDWTVVTGYSMGGFGTYRLLARWPDLFSRGWSVVGVPGTVDDQLISLRNTPLLAWNSTEDELVNISMSEQAVKDDTAAGLRFTEDLFLTADHLTLAANDQFQPGADWLGTHRVDRNPARVSFVVDKTEDSAVARTVSDHAYWLSSLQPRGKGDAVVDAFSQGFGQGVPLVIPVAAGGGALTGGELPALAYVQRSQTWAATPRTHPRNVLTIDAKNLAAMTLDVRRAHVSCGVDLLVKTDGPLTVTLGGCDKTLRFR